MRRAALKVRLSSSSVCRDVSPDVELLCVKSQPLEIRLRSERVSQGGSLAVIADNHICDISQIHLERGRAASGAGQAHRRLSIEVPTIVTVRTGRCGADDS